MKKIPMRMCVVTRERHPKNELVRIVSTDNGVIVDYTGKVNGHGVYIKNDLAVIETAKKTKILNKLLETNVEDNIYEELINNIK